MTIDHHDSVCGWCEQDGRVLLVHNRRYAEGRVFPTWDLPGGRVEPGETLPQTLAREWSEEVGGGAIEIDDLVYAEDGTVRDTAGGPRSSSWRTFVFRVRLLGDPGGGSHEHAWVPIDRLAERMTAPYHRGLLEWVADPTRVHVSVAWTDPLLPFEAGEPFDHLLALCAAGAAGRPELVADAAASARRGGQAVPRSRSRCSSWRPTRASRARSPRSKPRHRTWTRRARWGGRRAGARPATRQGTQCFADVYGDTAVRIHEGLDALHPTLATWIRSFAYGRVLCRDEVLTLLQRELLASSLLTAMGGLEAPLLGHLRAARRLGASPDDLRRALAAAYAAAPAGPSTRRSVCWSGCSAVRRARGRAISPRCRGGQARLSETAPIGF
ncbi:MAG: NUDIX domain-containing protein [Planctomycetota bacterium]